MTWKPVTHRSLVADRACDRSWRRQAGDHSTRPAIRRIRCRSSTASATSSWPPISSISAVSMRRCRARPCPTILRRGKHCSRVLDPEITIFGAHGAARWELLPRAWEIRSCRTLLTALGRNPRRCAKSRSKTGPDCYEISDKMQLLVSPEAYGDLALDFPSYKDIFMS